MTDVEKLILLTIIYRLECAGYEKHFFCQNLSLLRMDLQNNLIDRNL